MEQYKTSIATDRVHFLSDYFMNGDPLTDTWTNTRVTIPPEQTTYATTTVRRFDWFELQKVLRQLAADIRNSAIGEDPNILDDLHELEKLI